VRDERGGGVRPGGDVGGGAQLAESFGVRFHHRDQPGAMVTYRWYAAIDLDDLTTITPNSRPSTWSEPTPPTPAAPRSGPTTTAPPWPTCPPSAASRPPPPPPSAAEGA
jgi:hypothetical protein